MDLLARYYDLIHNQMTEDLPMWEQFAAGAPGPILDVGCGTGRLLTHLTRAGHTLSGLDISEVALQAAEFKLRFYNFTERVTLYQVDMRDFDLPRRDFALAILAINTLMHCHTLEDQLATLRTIQAHLQPEGKLIIDLFYPDPVMLAEVDGRLYFEDDLFDDVGELTVQWYWRHSIDLAEQMRHLVYILDQIDSAGRIRRVQIPISLRFIYRYELELLLQTAGFRLAALYGNYDLEPFDSHSPRLIAVAVKSGTQKSSPESEPPPPPPADKPAPPESTSPPTKT